MFDVFISYPHQDKATADAACAALEADGIRCWIAPRDVHPGAVWADSIVSAINQCRVMVLIFSSNANKSKQVHREVQQAFDREKPVLPLRIEDIAPESSLGYYMGPVHWLDALTPPLEKHLLRLAQSAKALLEADSAMPQGALNRTLTPQAPMRPNEDVSHAVAQSARDHWVFFLVEGLVLVILGIAAIVIPPLASLAVTIFLGWLFLISGLVGLFTTFMMRHAPGFGWSLVSALLATATGLILLISPVTGVVSLTLVLIVFFMIEGIASIMFALDHRRELTGRWGWMFASGIVDLVLATIILAGLPGTAAWAIGLLVGINMLMGGVSLIGMALVARSGVSA